MCTNIHYFSSGKRSLKNSTCEIDLWHYITLIIFFEPGVCSLNRMYKKD